MPVNFTVMDGFPACASVSGHVRDQSDCGSCWAFGSTEAFNDRVCIASNGTTNMLLSPQDTASCCRGMSNGCGGGFVMEAWSYFVKDGVVSGNDNPDKGTGKSCFPYQLAMCDHHETGPYPDCSTLCGGKECATPKCAHSCEAQYPTAWAKDKHKAKSAYAVKKNVLAIQTELMTRGSVTASMEVYADFPTYKSGVYRHVSGSELGGHAVKIVGWGTEAGGDYWLVANSWNPTWGLNGFFKILRGKNECGIEDSIVAGLV